MVFGGMFFVANINRVLAINWLHCEFSMLEFLLNLRMTKKKGESVSYESTIGRTTLSVVNWATASHSATFLFF